MLSRPTRNPSRARTSPHAVRLAAPLRQCHHDPRPRPRPRPARRVLGTSESSLRRGQARRLPARGPDGGPGGASESPWRAGRPALYGPRGVTVPEAQPVAGSGGGAGGSGDPGPPPSPELGLSWSLELAALKFWALMRHSCLGVEPRELHVVTRRFNIACSCFPTFHSVHNRACLGRLACKRAILLSIDRSGSSGLLVCSHRTHTTGPWLTALSNR